MASIHVKIPKPVTSERPGPSSRRSRPRFKVLITTIEEGGVMDPLSNENEDNELSFSHDPKDTGKEESLQKAKVHCLVCYESFIYSKAFSFRNNFGSKYCEKVLRTFCRLLQLHICDTTARESLDNVVQTFQFEDIPLPFCAKCSDMVLRLIKMQDEVQALQESIAVEMNDIALRIQDTENENDNQHSSGNTTYQHEAFVQKYNETLETIRTSVLQSTASTSVNQESWEVRVKTEPTEEILYEDGDGQNTEIYSDDLNEEDSYHHHHHPEANEGLPHCVVKVKPLPALYDGKVAKSRIDNANRDAGHQTTRTSLPKRRAALKAESTISKLRKVAGDENQHSDTEWGVCGDNGGNEISNESDEFEEGLEKSRVKSSKVDLKKPKHTILIKKKEPKETGLQVKKSHKKKGYANKTSRQPLIHTTDGFQFMGVNIKKVEIDDQKKFRCDLCSATKGLMSTMRCHIRQAHPNGLLIKEYTCTICKKILTNAESFSRHNKIYHSMVPRTYYQCDLCGKSLASVRALDNHRATFHSLVKENFYFCDICQRPFQVKKQMKIHRVSHMNEDDKLEYLNADPESKKYIFTCSYCPKTCSSRSNLRIHEMVHTNTTLFSCEICSKGFRTKQAHTIHQQVNHGYGERTYPFTCDYPDCGRKFSRRRQLEGHTYDHYPLEKPFKCPFCEASFKFAPELTVHKRMHTKEKPYLCTLCGNKFSRSGHLRRHYKNIHGLAPSSIPPRPMKIGN